jgi:hypothetical protein
MGSFAGEPSGWGGLAPSDADLDGTLAEGSLFGTFSGPPGGIQQIEQSQLVCQLTALRFDLRVAVKDPRHRQARG